MQIIKRNGQKVEFNKEKIYNAINMANDNVKNKYKLTKTKIKEITDNVAATYESGNRIKSVEAIQDMVEEALVDAGAYGVAKEYITYRYKRNVARGFGEDFTKTISEKLMAQDVQNQNANVDENSFGGRMGEASGVMTRKYALEYLLSPMARSNHENNEIYIHDLDHYAVGDHNCLSMPLDDLLANGFKTRQTDVRPAGSVSTAFQLVAVLFQLQSLQQFGGVSATHLDWTMVPYVRKSFYKHWKDGNKYCCKGSEVNKYSPETALDDYCDSPATAYAEDMTKKEIHQAVEGLYHNLK